MPGGRTDRQRDRQTGRQADMTKLIVAFRNFANASKTVLLVQARFVRLIVVSDSPFTDVKTIFFFLVTLDRVYVVWFLQGVIFWRLRYSTLFLYCRFRIFF